MKKLFGVILALAMCIGVVNVQATTYENSAFIGTWRAYGENGAANAFLYVDYCDEYRIKCRFETFKDGEMERKYEIYQCDIDDTKAQTTFSTVDSINNWYPKGDCTIELLTDMIEFSIVTDNGINLYNGFFKSVTEEFSAYASPYNYNVGITLNSAPIESELKPFILKNRTYVPLRGVFEAMGINVEWFDTKANENGVEVHTHEIKATRNDISVSMKKQSKAGKGFGSWYMTKTVLGEVSEIDLSEIQPVIINDNTYVPLRVIVESFDTAIDWNNDARMVVIDDKLSTGYVPPEFVEVTPTVDENEVTKNPEETTDVVEPLEKEVIEEEIVEEEIVEEPSKEEIADTQITTPEEESTHENGEVVEFFPDEDKSEIDEGVME